MKECREIQKMYDLKVVQALSNTIGINFTCGIETLVNKISFTFLLIQRKCVLS